MKKNSGPEGNRTPVQTNYQYHHFYMLSTDNVRFMHDT